MPKSKGKTGGDSIRGEDRSISQKAGNKRAMTGREYRETPEYQKKAQEDFDRITEELATKMEPGLKVVREAQESFENALENSGVLEATAAIGEQMKKIQDVHQSIFEEKNRFIAIAPAKETHLSQNSIDRLASSLRGGEATKEDSASKIFILDEDDNLYLEANSRLRYSLRRSRKPIKIIRTLIHQATFMKSTELSDEVGYKTNRVLAKTINKINAQAKEIFDLPDEEHKRLIVSKPHSGYRMNPIYIIQER